MSRYKVLIDDNFHYMDVDARSALGTFDTAEDAIAACREIVDSCLRDNYKPGMSTPELYQRYMRFGDDPFIVLLDAAAAPVSFSAWTYAKQRCGVICEAVPSRVESERA